MFYKCARLTVTVIMRCVCLFILVHYLVNKCDCVCLGSIFGQQCSQSTDQDFKPVWYFANHYSQLTKIREYRKRLLDQPLVVALLKRNPAFMKLTALRKTSAESSFFKQALKYFNENGDFWPAHVEPNISCVTILQSYHKLVGQLYETVNKMLHAKAFDGEAAEFAKAEVESLGYNKNKMVIDIFSNPLVTTVLQTIENSVKKNITRELDIDELVENSLVPANNRTE